MFDAVADSDDPDPDAGLRAELDIVLDKVVEVSRKKRPDLCVLLLANIIESLAWFETELGRPANLGLTGVRFVVLCRHLKLGL